MFDLSGDDYFQDARENFLASNSFDAVMLCFNVNDRVSFEDIESKWASAIQDLRRDDGCPVMGYLVACQTGDAYPSLIRVVSESEAANYAQSSGYEYMETESRNAVHGVESCFVSILFKILDELN